MVGIKDKRTVGRSAFTLSKRNGSCIIRFETGNEEPVNVKWARPLTGKGSDVAFVNEKKRTVAMVPSLEELDESSRAVAMEALDIRYLLPRVTAVNRTRQHFGILFWEIDTNCGPKQFAMRSAHRNIFYLDEDHMFLRDVIGNMYEIESLKALDRKSQEWIESVV